MATGDFTFPISDAASQVFLDSPPLWHASSTASPSEESTRRGQQETRNVKQRKSFSCIEGAFMKRSMTREDEEEEDDDDNEENINGEEKMDSLWEDFNEHVCKAHDIPRADGINLGQEHIDLGCFPASTFKPSKINRGGAGVSSKKQSGVVLMKVFKKLFLFRHNSKSQHFVKKRF